MCKKHSEYKDLKEWLAHHESRLDALHLRLSALEKNIETKKENKQMATLNLASPWIKLYHEIEALFREDPLVNVVLDEENYIVKIYAEEAKKSAALKRLLECERIYGNITVKVIVYPSNESLAEGFSNMIDVFASAFENNPILSFVQGGYLPIIKDDIYVVFRNEVVQYFNDDLGDINGNCSTLAQEIAKNIFVIPEGAKVHFCTNVRSNPGKIYHQWT